MSDDFYGIGPHEMPAYVGMADRSISFFDLPEETKSGIAFILEQMRALHAWNPLAFEAAIGFVAEQVRQCYDGRP